MSTRILTAVFCGLTVVLAMLAGRADAAPVQRASTIYTKHACAAPAEPGRDECFVVTRTAENGTPLNAKPADVSSLPEGYGPEQLRSAYQLEQASADDGAGETVAVVDAYDDPNAAADLAAYRSEYGLPACTVASGCFRQVNQEGDPSPLPAGNTSWATEESLDIEMVSAICPLCHIILAEANDNQDSDLAATVSAAVAIGATQVSNSYGESENPGEASLESSYDHPGVEITASAGDDGYGVSYPAASAYVTSVGGTTLWPAGGSRGWTESVWSGSGSGCSAVIAKPSWQHDACTHRTDNDISAVADPQTPVAIYDTDGAGGWLIVGGTSVSSPIIASVYALMSKTAAQYPGGSYWYSHPKNVFGVTSGANGTCDPAYLCTAGDGYNGPAGNGTPDFTGASLTTSSCVNDWGPAPAQSIPGNVPNAITGGYDYGIDALSATDVWTTGFYSAAAAGLPGVDLGFVGALEHWNGSSWTTALPPELLTGTGMSSSVFTSLSFDNPGDGWAAGFREPAYNDLDGAPIVSHWNGSGWSSSPVLYPLKTITDDGNTAVDFTEPTAITAISPDDVWMTGEYIGGLASDENFDGSFTEHWNGSSWTVVSFPGQDGIRLSGLKGFTANDVWAVGEGPDGAVALRWDGSAWTTVTVPQPPAGSLTFTSVSGTSPDDVWAVGSDKDTSQLSNGIPLDTPYIMHWNGHVWSDTPVADVASVEGLGTGFSAVTAISPSDAWAVGTWWGETEGTFQVSADLLAHWNGQQWSIVPGITTSHPDGLLAVSGAGQGNVWISGENITTDGGSYVPSLLRYGCGKE
jgi:hypothetical protein